MKKILFLLLVLANTTIYSQFVSKSNTVIKIEKSDVVTVVLGENAEVNDLLKKSMESFWTACKYEYKTKEEIISGGIKTKFYISVIHISSYGYNLGNGTNATLSSGMNVIREKSRVFIGITSSTFEQDLIKYKNSKNKDENIILNKLGGMLYSVFADPYNPDYKLLPINIKTLNWMATTDIKTYMPDGYSDEAYSITCFNKNQAKLKNTTILVNKSYTKTGNKLDATCKGFNLTECKEFYKGKIEVKTMEEIINLVFASNQEKQYAILIHGINERTQTTFLYSLSTGEILCGFDVAMSSSPGCTKTFYKILGEKYDGK